MSLTDKKVAILVDNFFEEAEFTGPLTALQGIGATVHIIGVSQKDLKGMNHAEQADDFTADLLLDDADTESYDALVLPGGGINADSLRMSEKARQWVRQFLEAGKPVAAICHAPWLLVSAGVAKGKKLTSYYTIQDDMKNAGAEWVDEEVVIDNNLITSRNPDDVPAFNSAIVSMLQIA